MNHDAPTPPPPAAAPPLPRSVYDAFRLPGGGFDFRALEDAGFDVEREWG